ncbi:MAG TPA: hypothetical protein DCM67_05155 [Propionibacteriaceae bacterium]|nr:hypothetical protein [Propionibacteriaceae bacterium]
MDESAERDSGLTWEAYLPGLFDQPASAVPSPSAIPSPLAELVEARPGTLRQAQGTDTPPRNRQGVSPRPTPASFPPPAASSRFVARSAGRTPLSPIGALTMGIAIFLAFLIFIALLP